MKSLDLNHYLYVSTTVQLYLSVYLICKYIPHSSRLCGCFFFYFDRPQCSLHLLTFSFFRNEELKIEKKRLKSLTVAVENDQLFLLHLYSSLLSHVLFHTTISISFWVTLLSAVICKVHEHAVSFKKKKKRKGRVCKFFFVCVTCQFCGALCGQVVKLRCHMTSSRTSLLLQLSNIESRRHHNPAKTYLPHRVKRKPNVIFHLINLLFFFFFNRYYLKIKPIERKVSQCVFGLSRAV